MASVTKSPPISPQTRKPTVVAADTTTALSLPRSPTKPSHEISDYHILIVGDMKIGKTTLSTVEGDVLLLTFDPLQKAQELLQRHVPNWSTFMEYLKLLKAAAAESVYPYKRVVVDGADIFYRKCQTWVEKKLVVEHVSDEDWGKGWDLLKYTFSTAVDELMALPGGAWFISHAEWRDVKTREGSVKKFCPLIKSGAEDILLGRCDGCFIYTYRKGKRVLIIKGDETLAAGHRIKGHFMTPDGEYVEEIPMGTSEDESWNNLLTAFENKQPFVRTESPVASSGKENSKINLPKK